jgi:hypothetical protein
MTPEEQALINSSSNDLSNTLNTTPAANNNNNNNVLILQVSAQTPNTTVQREPNHGFSAAYLFSSLQTGRAIIVENNHALNLMINNTINQNNHSPRP